MNFTKKTAILNFCILTTLSFILIIATNHFILTPNFYQKNGEEVSSFSADSATVYSNIINWIYLLEAIYLAVKLSIVSLILYTALYLKNYQVPFWKVFNIVTFGEYLFILAAFCKIIWFSYFYPDGTLLQWHQVYMLSALYFFEAVPADWFYPLQTLNVFEVSYWFLLAWGINQVSNLKYDSALNLVVTSYLPALLIWVACAMFCTLMFFPEQG